MDRRQDACRDRAAAIEVRTEADKSPSLFIRLWRWLLAYTPLGRIYYRRYSQRLVQEFRTLALLGRATDASFDYRIVARRRGYEGVRMAPAPAESPRPHLPAAPTKIEPLVKP